MSLAIAPVTITLTKLKLHLNIEAAFTDDDTELQFFLDAALAWIATQVDVAYLNTAPVQLATLELIRHWWDSQRGPGAGTLDAEGSLGLLGFAIPHRVKEILAPYLRTSAPPAAVGSFPAAATWPDPIPW